MTIINKVLHRLFTVSVKNSLRLMKNKDFLTKPSSFHHVVRGSNYETGLQQGLTNAQKIRNWLDTIFSEPGIGKLRYLKNHIRILLPLLSRISKFHLKKTMEQYLPEELEQLQGLSKGAGCSEKILFLQQAIEILGAYPVYKAGCSSIGIDSTLSECGAIILGKNFDYLPFLNTFQILRECYPTERYASIELTMAPMVGSHAGMNEHGLTILYNYAFSKDKRQRGVPLSMLIHHFLQTCPTVKHVLNKIENIPHASGGILLMGDNESNLAVVELSNKRLAVMEICGEWAIATNHFADPEMKQYGIPTASRYHPFLLPAPWKGVRIHETSEMRYRDIRASFQNPGKISLDKIKNILANHGDSTGGNNNSVCRHSKISSTLSSAVFMPSKLQVLYCHGAPCLEPYQSFHLDVIKNR